MKILIGLLFLTLLRSNTEPNLYIKNEKISITLKKGEKKNIIVPILNTGDKPLIIYAVEPTCGCTVSEFPNKPILKNQEKNISLLFSSTHKPVGRSTVYVTIKTNAPYKFSKLILSATITK